MAAEDRRDVRGRGAIKEEKEKEKTPVAESKALFSQLGFVVLVGIVIVEAIVLWIVFEFIRGGQEIRINVDNRVASKYVRIVEVQTTIPSVLAPVSSRERPLQFVIEISAGIRPEHEKIVNEKVKNLEGKIESEIREMMQSVPPGEVYMESTKMTLQSSIKKKLNDLLGGELVIDVAFPKYEMF